MTNSTSTRATGSQGLAIAALVLGIVSASISILWFISIILGVLAIIFGAVSLKSPGRKKAVSGIITGIVGIIFSLLFFFMAYIALPALQSGQVDTAAKNDIAVLMSDISSYQSMNRGQLPEPHELSTSGLTEIFAVYGDGNPAEGTAIYKVGINCSGDEVAQRSYSVSTLLGSGYVFCIDS